MLDRVRRLTVLVTAVVIAGCAPATSSSPGPASPAASAPSTSSASPAPSASSVAEAVTLNLWTIEGEEDFLPKLKAAFETAHPGVTLEITVLPEDQYGTKVDTALAAGAPPDIAFIFDPRYIKEGHMVPIGDVLKERGVDLSRFAQGPLSSCTLDGKLYCIGTYTGALVLMYNKDVFDAQTAQGHALNQVVREVSVEKSVALIDLHKDFEHLEHAHYFYDLAHPNAAGCEKLAEIISEVLRPQL